MKEIDCCYNIGVKDQGQICLNFKANSTFIFTEGVITCIRHNIVNPEIFARILFARIALKDNLAALKIRD